jgi:2,4-dienoyl-CoA reductase-like NADH-dependent reductase (Old Yellow Enzyme family)
VRVFETARIGRAVLANRVLRSATFEGLCDDRGNPGPQYEQLYADLAAQQIGALITGFTYVRQDGKAMQPGQAGIESDTKVERFRRVTESVHARGCPIFLQLAHAGRQTNPMAAGGAIYSPSAKKSPYFRYRPRALASPHLEEIIRSFAEAARRAKAAGFDGVQLHAAHGYLVHQFLHPAVNHRTDAYGIDKSSGLGTRFMDRIIDGVRTTCGMDYPILVKVSAGDNYRDGLGEPQFIQLIRFLDAKRVEAIEVSFGTMDHAFNIFRGESIPLKAILDVNPRYATRSPLRRWAWHTLVLPVIKRRLQPFAPMYNLPAARLAKQHTRIPIISVGGFRSGADVHCAIEEHGIDFVSLCRPLVCEPDFVTRFRTNPQYRSRCSNCNQCAVMCDSGAATRCYGRRSSLPLPSEGEGLEFGTLSHPMGEGARRAGEGQICSQS